MTLNVKSAAVYDALVNLIDTINHEPDPLLRLTLFSYLAGLYETRVLPERDRSAYEARERYSIDNITQVSGSEPKQVYYWASRHQQRKDKPPLKRRYQQDVSGAVEVAAEFKRSNPAATAYHRKRARLVDPGNPPEGE
jgi:hypothetical protein